MSARRGGNVLAQPKHCEAVSVDVATFYERKVAGDEDDEPCHASPGKTMPPRWNKVDVRIGRSVVGHTQY